MHTHTHARAHTKEMRIRLSNFHASNANADDNVTFKSYNSRFIGLEKVSLYFNAKVEQVFFIF